MRLKAFVFVIALMFFSLAVVASASHTPTNLRIIKSSAKTVTIGWSAVPGVTGYGLYRDGVRISTAGVAATQAKFGTPEYRRYVLGVQALKTGGATSSITVEPRWETVSVDIPPEPPPTNDNQVPASIAADCSQDVTAALQAWLNGRPNNVTLTFPSGSCYRVEGGLTLTSRTGLILSGVGSTLKATTVGDGHRSNIRSVDGSSLTVRGFRLEGGYSNSGTHDPAVQWSHGVELLGTQTALIEDVTVVSVGGDCVYLGLGAARTRDATIRRLTCTGTGRNGVSFVAADRSVVESSSTNTVGYIPFDVEPNSGTGFGVDTATITGNTIGSYAINAFTIVGSAPVSNVTFSNNQITAPLGGRIQVTGLPRRTNVTISGNSASQTLSYPQAIRLDNVDVATVTNNTLPTTGVMLRCASVTGLVFSGNTPSTADSCTTTPPPVPNGANLWVDASGGTCTRTATAGAYLNAAACPSFAAAYSAAVSGDTVGVTGTLGEQFFAGDWRSTQPSGTKTLTFRGVAGNDVHQIVFGSPNLTFDGINVDAGGVKTSGATFENGGDPFTFKNGSIGNVRDEKGALTTGSGIVFDNVLFHDVYIVTAGVHNECLWAGVPEGMIVRNSRFERCATMDIFFTYPDYWSPLPPPYYNVTIEGNWFGVPRGIGTPGGPQGYSLYIAKNGASNQYPMSGWRIRNNYVEPGSYGVNNDQAVGANNVFCGNTGNVPGNWQVAC